VKTAQFIADMNGLQAELALLPDEVTRLIASLMDLVEEQERLLQTMLTVNKKLIDRK
jgi:hypothetical protein